MKHKVAAFDFRSDRPVNNQGNRDKAQILFSELWNLFKTGNHGNRSEINGPIGHFTVMVAREAGVDLF